MVSREFRFNIFRSGNGNENNNINSDNVVTNNITDSKKKQIKLQRNSEIIQYPLCIHL